MTKENPYSKRAKKQFINLTTAKLRDDFFNKVENKTKVNKDTILSLAEKLNNGNMKDEKTIREVISTLSSITGKNVSKEKEDKIIDTILKDKVPKSIDKMF